MNDTDALWSAHGLVHRMETLSISFRHRASALRHYGHAETAMESEHAADMIQRILAAFQADYDANRKP